jgi:uncharacterized protein (UPF0548 family)
MIALHRPSPAEIDAYLARVRPLPLSYPEVGASRDDAAPAGYVADHRRIQVGVGERAFRAACECLRRWDMFRLGWISLCWPHTPPVPGATIASLTRLACVWWLNPCRVVYVEEPADGRPRFRFAYGTLAGHVETGEERFTVEQLRDGAVWYDLYAFSRPGVWLTRVGYPAVRQLQKKFGRDSLAAFARAVRRRLAEMPGEVVA